jgi:hypothetical protein
MKLIIRQYLSSLRERGELDAVLPDLLSQLGLIVFSRPQRGTRQDGVDVAAVGSLDGGPEKVYLFSIKPGDLTRRDWSSDSAQSLRPSLDQILDSYIPHRLPAEHKDKDIVICIAIGGDVQEQVRPDLQGYTSKNSKENISYEEWNGDKIANYIQASFLREDLLPSHARSSLRKSLALLDEPDVSYRHFASLIRSLSVTEVASDVQKVTSIRQMSICLWILFAWCRDGKNTEAAYLSGELTLLHAWNIAKLYPGQKNKTATAVTDAFFSIFNAYHQICSDFLATNVLPHVDKLHGLSSNVTGSCSLDVNLKMFDLLGRLGIDGIWAYWGVQRCPPEEHELKQAREAELFKLANAVKTLISNNPTLLLPSKDDHAIDISIALSLVIIDGNNGDDIRNWLTEILGRCRFALVTNGQYPSVFHSYADLLLHPKSGDAEYRERAASGSILYPMIALWAALLNDDQLYDQVAKLKREQLPKCTFQFWYPDENSETHFYINSAAHGAAMADLSLDQPKERFLLHAFEECKHSPHFHELTAVKMGWWPLVIVACRHYRLPLPLHLLEGLHRKTCKDQGVEECPKNVGAEGTD